MGYSGEAIGPRADVVTVDYSHPRVEQPFPADPGGSKLTDDRAAPSRSPTSAADPQGIVATLRSGRSMAVHDNGGAQTKSTIFLTSRIMILFRAELIVNRRDGGIWTDVRRDCLPIFNVTSLRFANLAWTSVTFLASQSIS